jgi:hypothetical protein
MTFNQLKTYLEEEGCTFEHLDQNIYMAKNCINAEICILEDLSFYNTVTLAHYFYELKVQPPDHLQDFLHVYDAFRNNELSKFNK